MTKKKVNKKAGTQTSKPQTSSSEKKGEGSVGCETKATHPSTYAVRMQCNNCSFHGNVTYPRGVPVSVSAQECPNCGCKTLSRSNDPFPGLRMPTVTPGRDRPVLLVGNDEAHRCTVEIPDDPHRSKRGPINVQSLSKEDTEHWISLLRLADSE